MYAISLLVHCSSNQRDGSSLVVTEDVELRVGTDLKSVWLVATPTASVITPMGKKKVTYSGTRAQIPFGSIQFDTRFKGPGMGGDMLARKSIPYHGAIETSIQKHQIPNGSYAHCRREYLKLLRDGFVSFAVDMETPMLILVQARKCEHRSHSTRICRYWLFDVKTGPEDSHVPGDPESQRA